VRRTKILCTIGPATQDEASLRQLVDAGMDVARLNFSHGTHESHGAVIRRLRAIEEETGRPVGILQDLCGPKIRTGPFRGGTATFAGDAAVSIEEGREEGDAAGFAVNFPLSAARLQPGHRVLLADGAVALRVESFRPEAVVCTVVRGGTVRSHSGVNLPDSRMELPAVTAKDRDDLAFGLAQGIDAVALSFVQTADDVQEAKRLVQGDGRFVPVIAKIETAEAVRNLDAVLDAAHGAMVARGDLGVELDLAEVPLVQKRIIRLCRCLGMPVITATQMMESMVLNPVPTRAEASDVANAILDGTDAVMLSSETSVGKHPLAAVRAMAHVAETAEGGLDFKELFRGEAIKEMQITGAVGHAACSVALDLDCRAIAACTASGRTAAVVSRYHPACPVYGLSYDPVVRRRLCFLWGVVPMAMPRVEDADGMIAAAVEVLREAGRVAAGDVVVVTGGHPLGSPGGTNLIKVVNA
jgi:pyruvate kinase